MMPFLRLTLDLFFGFMTSSKAVLPKDFTGLTCSLLKVAGTAYFTESSRIFWASAAMSTRRVFYWGVSISILSCSRIMLMSADCFTLGLLLGFLLLARNAADCLFWSAATSCFLLSSELVTSVLPLRGGGFEITLSVFLPTSLKGWAKMAPSFSCYWV